ncbi:unnamed protein product, partial [marine sediment metagenome]
EEQEKQLNIILNSSNHLHGLINDVLDITKIEVKKLEIRNDVFDLVKELSKLKESFNLDIKSKGLEIIMNSPETLTIYDDKKRINQILINLIGNAIKFTEKGKISIKVKKKNEETALNSR